MNNREEYKSLEAALVAQMCKIRDQSRAPKKKQRRYLDLIRYLNDNDCFRGWEPRRRAYRKARCKKFELELKKQYDSLSSKPKTFLDYVYSLIDLNAFSETDIALWCQMYMVATTDYGYTFTAYAPNNHRKPLSHDCHTYYDFAKWICGYGEEVQSNDRFFWGYFGKVSPGKDNYYYTRARGRGCYLLRYFANEECFSIKDLSDITTRLGITKDRFFDVLDTIISAGKKK